MANKIPTDKEVLSSLGGIDSVTGLQGAKKTKAFPTDKEVLAGISSSNEAFFGGASMGLNPDEFPFHLSVGSDNEELRAMDQSWGQQTLYGLGRLAGTTATKFLEGAGYLYGIGEGIVRTLSGQDREDVVSNALDNGWINFFGNLEEGIKEQLPIYHTKKYTEGNILKQMGTWGFYMDDLVDGVAFLVSAALGSKGVGLAGEFTGAYGKLARAYSKATQMAKAGKVSKTAMVPLNTIIKDMDLVTMTLFNSYVEASFEAKDTMDQLLEKGLSREEAAKAAQGTFWWNVGILMVPNFITNSMFFGKANPLSGRIKNITGPEGKLLSEVKPITTGQRVGAFASGSVTSVTSEGPWEENIQLAIQNYFTARAKGEDNREQIEGIFSNWAKNFTTDEGLKAIALGSMVGLIPGGYHGMKQAEADKKNEANLHTMLSHTIASVSKDLDKKDVWLRDKDSNIITDKETGKHVVDPYKLATIFITSHYTTQNALKTMATISEGNDLMLDRLEEERVSSLAFSHMGSIDGQQTFEAEMDAYARQKVESMQSKGEEVDENKVKELANQYKQRGNLYKTLYDNVQEVFGGLYNFQEASTGNKEKDALLNSLANKVKDNAILSQFMASVDQMFWIDKAKELDMEIAKLNSSTVGQTELGKAKIEQLKKLGEAVQDQIKTSESVVKSVLKEKLWKDSYNKAKEAQLKELEGVTEVKPTDATTETKPEAVETEEEKKIREEETGKITSETSTLQEEIKARTEEIEADEETRVRALKDSAIQELTEPVDSAIEVTGSETEEELTKKATTISLAERYGDRVLSNMTLSEIFTLPLKEDILEVLYQGEHGTLFIDSENNDIVFKSTETGKEYIIGKTTDSELYAGEIKAIDLGIIPMNFTTYDIRLSEDGVGIIIQGRRYVMDLNDPLSAIQEIDGELSVTLKDLNGVPITFTSPVLAAELAFALELLNEAREVAYQEYLNEEDSDFTVVTYPDTNQTYYVYKMVDGKYEILEPPTAVELNDKTIYINPNKSKFKKVNDTLANGKPNPRYYKILQAYLNDLGSIMDKVAAEYIAAGNRTTEEERKEIKERVKNEIKEFVRDSRPATAEEVVNAPGSSEVSSVKAEKTQKTGKSKVDETTGGTPGTQSTTEQKVDVEIEVEPTKKKSKKKKSKDEEEIVDEKAEELAKSKPVKAKKKGADTAEDEGIETDNLEEKESEIESKKLPWSMHIAHPSTAVAWKAEDNPELDKFLSDPNNKLEGYTLVASIDYDYVDKDWTTLKHNPDYIKQHINKIYKDRHDTDAFDSLVDVIAVKLTLRDSKGNVLPYKGMYLHKSAFSTEDTVVVTEEQRQMWERGDIAGYEKSRRAMIVEERKASRAERKAIVKDLLAGKEVVITGLEKGAGVMSQTKGQNRNMSEVVDSPDTGVLAIVDASNTLWDGKGAGRPLPGRASTGNVVWSTNETANGDERIVKMNVSKLSEEHANILLKAFIQLVNSEAGPNTLYSGKEVEGGLTVGQVINYLVLEGQITNQKNKEKNPEYHPYLVAKTLYTENGILYYGNKTLNLRNVSKDAARDFVNHITKHKNYNVPTAFKSGNGIGGKLSETFSIGSIEGKKGDTYQAFLFRNGMVQTDLIRDKVTGRIFSKPAFYFNSYKSDKTAADREETAAKESKKEQAESKPKKDEITKTEKKKAKAVTKAYDESNLPQMKTTDDLASLPEGVDIFLYQTGMSQSLEDDSMSEKVVLYTHVIGRTEKVESGEIVFRVKAEDERWQKKLEGYDGILMTDKKMQLLWSKFPGYPIHAELPKISESEREEILGDISRDVQQELDEIDGVAPFAHTYTGATYDKGDLEQAIKNLRKKLGPKFTIKTEEDFIKVIEKTGTILAFATFQKDAITLSRKLAKGSEYEEAFHRVSLLYLSPEEQETIYKEARVRYNMRGASTREVNERLAAEYREMEVRNGKIASPKTLAGKIKQFFTDLLDFITTVFTGKLHISNLDVDNLFRIISKSSGVTGRLWHSRPEARANELIKRGDVYTHSVKGRELRYIKNTAQLTDIVNHLVFTMVNHSGVYKTKDIGSLKYMVARDAMVKRREVILGMVTKATLDNKPKAAAHYANVAAMYQEIVDNYGIFLDLMKSQIEALGIRTLLPEDPEDENDNRGDNFIRYEKAAFELNSKDNAGSAVKLVIATLRATDKLDSNTLLSKFVDYDTMFDTLQEELSELNTYEEMLEVLKTKTSQPYKDLVEKLEKDHKEDPFDTLNTQFFHAMRRNRYNYKNVLATKRGGKFKVEVSDAETQKVSNAQTMVWGQAFMLSEAFIDGLVNKTFLSSVVRDFTVLSNQVKKEYYNKNNNNELPSYTKLFNDTINLFNKVSIPIDEDVLNNILDSISPNDKHGALYDFLITMRTSKVFGSRGTFAGLASTGKITNNKGTEMLLDNIFKNEQLFTKVVAPAYLEIHGGMRTNSILGPDGNPYYLLSENSYLTDLFHAIRSNPSFGVNYTQLAGVSSNEHSNVLEQLADPDVRKKLNVVVFSSLSMMKSNDRGRSYLDISDLEDTLVKMGLFEAGLIVLPQLADRRHLYAMMGLKPLKFNFTYNENTNELKLPQSVVDRFYYYAVDEYKQIKRVKAEIAKAKRDGTTHLLKENYHFTYNKDGSRNYENANGLKYQHFVEFNGKGYKLDPKDAKSDSLVSTYKSYVERILNDRIKDAIEHFGNQGIVKVTHKGNDIASVVNMLMDDESIKKMSKDFGGNIDLTLRNRIANFQLNSIAATIESEKVIFMSAAYYKNLDDKIKRYTAIASTGTVGRLNIPHAILPEDRLLHNQDKFNYGVLSTQLFDAVHVRSILEPKFTEAFKKRGYSDEEAKKRAIKALDLYTSVDATDGQAYITPDMFRALSIRLGEWTQTKQDAFDLLKITDRELTVPEQRVVDDLFMQPLKFGYFGPELSSKTASPLYFKMSLATLTPRLVKGTQLETLYQAMTNAENPIDMILFDSAVKVGVGAKQDYYFVDEEGNLDTSLVNSVEILNMEPSFASFQYLRRQTITDPHNELRDVVKTQFRKIALSNIEDTREYKVGNETVKGKDLKEENKVLMNELSDRGVEEFLGMIGVDSETLLSADPSKLDALLRTAARKSSMPDALIDALAEQVDGERYEHDAIPDRKWLESHQISLLSKKTVDIKLPGTALIQMTNFGLRKAEKDDSLKLIDDDGFMQAKVSVEVFRDAIPDYYKKTYKERLEYANKMFVGIGYRVPTQGLVSTAPLKIVGFLPETSTATIVLPSEFTTLTGSDFDIDKLYFIRHNYKVVKGEPVKVQYLTDSNSTIDQRLEAFSYEAVKAETRQMRKGWYIALHDVYGDRAELKEIYRELLDGTDRSITDDSELDTTSAEFQIRLGYMRRLVKSELDNLSADLARQRKVLEEEIEENRRQWKENHMLEFIDRPLLKQNTKAAIENKMVDMYFAVQLSNDHIIDNYMPLVATVEVMKKMADDVSSLEGTSRDYPSLHTASFIYQSEVKHKYLWGKKGIGPFARANVHHVLGQIAGIHLGDYLGVGNTKEYNGRTVTDLSKVYGQDKESILDWLSTLINAHVDIAKDPFVFNLNVNNSTYSVGELLIRAGAGGKNTFMFLAQPILKEYAMASNNYRGKIRATSRKPLSEIKAKYKASLHRAMRVEKLTKEPIVTDEIFEVERLRKDINIKTPRNAVYYARQLQILEKFGELNKYGTFLFQAVEATTVDTKRFGKNIAELRRFNKLVNKVLNDNVIKNMDKVFEMTYVGKFYQNTVLLGQSIFKDTTVMASDAVTALHDRIMEEIGLSNDVTREGLWYLNHINDEIFASIVGRFMVNDMGVDTDKLRDMLYGNNSMVARFNKIKNNKKYADNPLVKLLQPSMSFREGIPDIIITFAATDVKTKWAKDRIIDGWAELITSSDPKIAEFAKDLVTYSFFTSGFKKSVYSIFHFIPPAYLKEIGFSRYMKNMRNEFNETTNYGLLESVHDDVFQNLWSEEDIVPFVDFKDLGQVRRPSAKLNWGEKYPQQISISNAPGVGSELSAADKLLLGYNEHMEGIYKPFIKIESDNIFYLYKFVGYNIKEDGSTEPVYVITKKKGFYEAGKVVKEHGLPKSVIDENESRDLPETFNYAAVGYKADEQGNVTKKTYDFSGFHRIEPQYLKVVTPVEEETWGDFDLEEGELLEDYNQTTGLPVGITGSSSSIEGATKEKIEELKKKYKPCKGV